MIANFSRMPRWLPILLLIIAMLSIQSGAALAKSLFPSIGPQGVTAVRLGLGTIILVFVFKPWRLTFSREQYLPLFLYGFALGCMNYLFYLSLNTIPLGIAVALEFTGPLAVALFSSRKPADFIWIIIAVVGLWFLLPLGDSVNDIDPLGAAYALGAGVCWAIYIIAGQKAGNGHGAATVAVGSIVAAIIFVPLGIAQATGSIWSLAILPIGLCIAVLSTALPYSLEMVALTRIPTRTFGILMSIEPGLAALSGIVFLGEHLSMIQWIALACIIVASAGSALTMRQESKIVALDVDSAVDK